MDIIYPPYNDNELESLIERLHPPGISVENDTCEDCTLIKVDSANRHGILLEMVQVLTDLDLIISKSYISSDGGWFMDVFHVTDQLGNKLTDKSLILYIKQALCATRRELKNEISEDINVYLGREVRPGQEDTALEIWGTDRPGLMSEILAVLVELGCNITASVAWKHDTRVACIVYIENGPHGGPITDPIRLAHVQEQLQHVVEAHHGAGERRGVRLTSPGPGRTHTERRLHQLMYADGDYERCRGCNGGASHKRGCDRTHVTIERCGEKEYWIVNIRSRDRSKLLFDTVCALTDLDYEVFHAVVASKGNMADQEYFIRHKYDQRLDTEQERRKLVLCLIAAIERRISHGMRLDLCCENQMGLLSDITRVLRESGLSMSRLEIATRDDRAFGVIYVTDSTGTDVSPDAVDLAINEIGGSIIAVHKSPDWGPRGFPPSTISKTTNIMVEHRPRLSFGSLLWSHLERISGSFRPIRS